MKDRYKHLENRTKVVAQEFNEREASKKSRRVVKREANGSIATFLVVIYGLLWLGVGYSFTEYDSNHLVFWAIALVFFILAFFVNQEPTT